MVDYCKVYYNNGKTETYESISKIKQRGGELILKDYWDKKTHISLYNVMKYDTDLKIIYEDGGKHKKKHGFFHF